MGVLWQNCLTISSEKDIGFDKGDIKYGKSLKRGMETNHSYF